MQTTRHLGLYLAVGCAVVLGCSSSSTLVQCFPVLSSVTLKMNAIVGIWMGVALSLPVLDSKRGTK